LELNFTIIEKEEIVMAFNQNNNFNNSNNGDKKKENFPIGKLWGSDGQLVVSMWIPPTGARAILRIKSIAGKDPSTGAPMLEQRMPSELPGFFMNLDLLKAFLVTVESAQDYGSLSFVIDKGNNSKLTVVGQGGTIKMTIDSAKNGSRTITFDSVAMGNKNVHAAFINLCEYLKIAYRKALTNKLDPDEFAMAVGTDNGNDDDLPI